MADSTRIGDNAWSDHAIDGTSKNLRNHPVDPSSTACSSTGGSSSVVPRVRRQKFGLYVLSVASKLAINSSTFS